MTYTIKTRGSAGLIVAEYLCPEHGRFEVTMADPPDETPCECGCASPWVISAPSMKNPSLAVTAAVRGGDSERRAGMLDTRPLAEGMSVKEWKAKQEPARLERRHQQLIAKGLKAKRIQVG